MRAMRSEAKDLGQAFNSLTFRFLTIKYEVKEA